LNKLNQWETLKTVSLRGPEALFHDTFSAESWRIKRVYWRSLGPQDNIVHFGYMKKNNRESRPALIGLEIKSPTDIETLKVRLKEKNFQYEYLNKNDNLLRFLV